MTTRLLAWTVAVVIAMLAVCSGLAGMLFTSTASGCQPTVDLTPGGLPSVGGWSGEQVTNAAIIVSVGAQLGVPRRGQIIAVATAMQESGLRNLSEGDRDSVGLFQQRPSQGWGTPEQLHDPVYAAGKFYRRLLTVPDWQALPLTEAAQAVQRSAYPEAYARHEPAATMLVDRVAGMIGPPTSAGPACQQASGPWTQPVIAPVVSGFRTRDRPSHDGVDLGAPRGTPIKAASAGTVAVVDCNVPAGRSCDVDGSPRIPGCGWYLDIHHGGGVTTRYCHLLTRPEVHVNQQVKTGEVVGLVGSSGNSSGPHLHFETHTGSPPRPVDPIQFMASVGAPLGT